MSGRRLLAAGRQTCPKILVHRRKGRNGWSEQASLTNSHHKSGQSKYFGSRGSQNLTEFVSNPLISQVLQSNEFVIPNIMSVNGISWTDAQLVRLESTELLGLSGFGSNKSTSMLRRSGSSGEPRAGNSR
jgi:hypothetical protein